MSSRLLRNIVAGPRAPHPEANLDLCYVTDNIIATSGPSATWPSLAYRNPLDQLVKFLDTKHGDQWCIWEFRAEGTGYPDEAVYHRIRHFPWPDHHPPPFALIPRIMAGMRDWLHNEDARFGFKSGNDQIIARPVGKGGKGGEAGDHRVVVVHCKAGKGRSGSMAISYLLSEEGWQREDALRRFTERRMRPGFGNGISIPSQLRWLTYVERWRDNGKLYLEQRIEVLEVHVWGLRDGVKISVEGYVEEGRKIKSFHTFSRQERDDIGENDTAAEEVNNNGIASVVSELLRQRSQRKSQKNSATTSRTQSPSSKPSEKDTSLKGSTSGDPSPAISKTSSINNDTEFPNVIFRPKQSINLPTNEVNLAVERRSRATYGWTMLTSVAHVWFNCFFEGNGPEHLKKSTSSQPTAPEQSGTFSIDWDAMDGIKGSSRKGTRAFDRVAVVWRVVPPSTYPPQRTQSSADSTSSKPAIPPITISTSPSSTETETAKEEKIHATTDRAAPGEIQLEPAPGQPIRDTTPPDWRRKHSTREGGARSPSGREPDVAQDVDIWAAPRRNKTADNSTSASASASDGEGEGDSDEEGVKGINRGVRLPESALSEAQRVELEARKKEQKQ